LAVESDIVLRSHSLVGGTLANDVLHRLREDIISCVLRPGEKLRFEALREIYGVSFSTLREALSRLASERLVVSEGQRGFIVAPISEEDLRDVTDARVVLERECIARAMARGGRDWKSGILSAYHKLDRLEATLNEQHRITPEWDQLHFDFHEALVSAAGSPTLEELRHSLFERARRYRRLSALVRKAPRVKSDEHRAIMETVLNGDTQAAQDLLERHIREIAQNIIVNGLRQEGAAA
jgi:GntR family carbon starvation induced transcriptional regulator